MIITRLTGGMGNQMFQYAAGLALAEHHRTVLKLDVDWFRHDPQYEAHNRYALSCFNITEQFATRTEIDRICGRPFTRIERASGWLAEKLHFYRHAESTRLAGHTYYNEHFYRRDPEFFTQPDPTYLHGMWQSDSYFKTVENLLRLHFSFRYPPASSHVEAMAERIRSDGPSAFIHFRRGDYIRNAEFNRTIGVLGMDYYQRALQELNRRVPGVTLYVFSDDMDAVEAEFIPDQPCVYVRAVEPWHPWDKIRLMSLCQHGVIANSTFSWWAGWLLPNPDKIIIAPNQWRRDTTHDYRDAAPKEWLKT